MHVHVCAHTSARTHTCTHRHIHTEHVASRQAPASRYLRLPASQTPPSWCSLKRQHSRPWEGGRFPGPRAAPGWLEFLALWEEEAATLSCRTTGSRAPNTDTGTHTRPHGPRLGLSHTPLLVPRNAHNSTYTHRSIRMQREVCTPRRMHTHALKHAHTCTHTCSHMYSYVHTHALTHAHTCTHAYTHVRKHALTCTHVHSQEDVAAEDAHTGTDFNSRLKLPGSTPSSSCPDPLTFRP